MKLYSLITLIAALSQTKPPKTFLRDMFVGQEKEHETEKFEVHTRKAKRIMAPFSGKYSAGSLIEKEGFSVEEYEPAIMKPYMRADAQRLLQADFGQTVYGKYANSQERAVSKLGEELQYLDDAIYRKETWMLAKLVTTGIIPVIGEGEDRAITYGGANIETLLGEDKWSETTSDPIEYLQEKIEEVGKETGMTVDTLIFSYDAYSAFRKHPVVAETLKQTNAQLVVLKPEKSSTGGRYMGYIAELGADIYTYSDWYTDEENNIEEPMLPAGGVLGIQKGFIDMNYGAVVIEPETEEEAPKLFAMKRVPYSWKEAGNKPRNIQLQSKPLPVPVDARGWFFTTAI